MRAAQAQTGQNGACFDAICVTVSFRSSFFCHSKVMETLSDSSRFLLLWSINLPFLWKRTHRRRRMSVLLFSCCSTFRYSQDLHAKKTAPVASWPMALCVSVDLLLATSATTERGTAGWCFLFGSLFLKALYNLDRSRPSSPSSSLVGFCLSFSRKVEATNEMAPLIVLSANSP